LYEFYPSRIPPIGSIDYIQYNLTESSYSEGGLGRSAVQQGGYQIAALCLTLGCAIVGGAITGLIIRFVPIFDQVKEVEKMFDDEPNWLLPEDENHNHNENKNVIDIQEKNERKMSL
jgi:hypothetical protein